MQAVQRYTGSQKNKNQTTETIFGCSVIESSHVFFSWNFDINLLEGVFL